MNQGRVLGVGSKYSADVAVLVAALKKVQEGELIKYQELEGQIGGRSVRQYPGRAWLRAARKKVFNEVKMDFAPVRGAGLRRLVPDETVDAGHNDLKIATRGIRRARKRATMPEESRLSPYHRETQKAVAAAAGMMELMGNSRGIEKIRKLGANTNGEVPSAKILEEFKK